MEGDARRLILKEILTEKQIHHVLKQTIGENIIWNLKWSEVRQAADGLAGFLGDHLKAVLHVEIQGEEKLVYLFLKRLPVGNKPKTDFITQNSFNKRERLMYQLLEEISIERSNPCCVKAYIYTDSIVVMPDLAMKGYSTKHYLDTLDLEHIFIATSSIARFHAAVVNYETQKSIDLKRLYTISQEFSDILTEPVYLKNSPFLGACHKVSIKFLQDLSTESYSNLPELESKLMQLYIQACDSLTEYKDTVNVIIHKDLWVNNIMFKYENNVPISAVLVDFQSFRYAPPAFDLMSFLYLTTSRRLREERENDICDHYYSTFIKSLNDDSKRRVKGLGYDKGNFLNWCEKGRMFGMLLAIASYPFILMDPKTAEKTFDDPETCTKHIQEDRSEPVADYAIRCQTYRFRNLEVTEEFVETYLLER